MLRGTRVAARSTIGFCVGAVLFWTAPFGGAAIGDDTSTTIETTTPTTVPVQPATRGTVVQQTPTLPPPTTTTTTTLAPTTLPPTTVPVPPTTRPSVNVAPANSGTGRRAVYSKGRQRVWVIDSNNVVLRTYLVSGRLSQPNYGTYSVFSRSSFTCNINHPDICMRYMVRFTKGPSGDNIGFHEIPRQNGWPLQSDSQLGTPLSGGCIRQATADAQYMWNWAYVGTKVVVIP